MAKYVKTTFLVLSFMFIYLFMMLLCQVVLGLSIGGAGKGLQSLMAGGSPIDQDALSEAADIAAQRVNDYVQRNTGVIFSISALLSVLVFMKIYSVRKLNLFSVAKADRKPTGLDIRYAVFAGVSANFIISIILMVIQSFGLFKESFARYDAQMESAFGTGGIVSTILGVALIVPLVEEILFRGMITYEVERVLPWKAALLIQGALFGLNHLMPLQIFYTIPIGVYFGFMAYKTGSVWPAAAAHMGMNTVAVILASPGMAGVFGDPRFAMFIIVLSLYMFVSAMFYFIKKKPVQTAPEKPAA